MQHIYYAVSVGRKLSICSICRSLCYFGQAETSCSASSRHLQKLQNGSCSILNLCKYGLKQPWPLINWIKQNTTSSRCLLNQARRFGMSLCDGYLCLAGKLRSSALYMPFLARRSICTAGQRSAQTIRAQRRNAICSILVYGCISNTFI